MICDPVALASRCARKPSVSPYSIQQAHYSPLLRPRRASPRSVPTPFQHSAAVTAAGARRDRLARRQAAPANTGGMSAVNRVLALDFDGVVCDSVGESALSAWRAGEALWPEIFKKASSAAEKDRVVEEMRIVRPVVETGYENIVQVRILLERLSTPQQMLDGWGEMLPAYMKQWGLERKLLVDLFGSTRDTWMAEDLAGWLAPNRIYPGVGAAVSAAVADPSADTSIVTTKQARFTHTILEELGGIKFDFERIFSQTVSGAPKTEVLAKLAAGAPASARLIFVEDKYSTLEKVAKAPGFEKWELYLVDWGYNTPRERAAAGANPRIEVVGVEEFAEVLRGTKAFAGGEGAAR